MTNGLLVHRLDELAAGIAAHGWHVAFSSAGPDEPSLAVRARLTGDATFHVRCDATGALLVTRDATDVGTAHSADDVHLLLRALAHRPAPLAA